MKKPLPKNLPTVFRGVCWDAHWEFDAPCVVYTPYQRYGFGGNSGEVESMVEDICIDLCIAHDDGKDMPRKKFHESDLKEFAWRGWSVRGFGKRKDAHHQLIKVKWWRDKTGELRFKLSVKEAFGKRPGI